MKFVNDIELSLISFAESDVSLSSSCQYYSFFSFRQSKHRAVTILGAPVTSNYRTGFDRNHVPEASASRRSRFLRV